MIDINQLVGMITSDPSLSGGQKVSLMNQLQQVPSGANLNMDTLQRMGLSALVGYLLGRGISGTLGGGQIGGVLGAAVGFMYDRQNQPREQGLPYGYSRNPY